MTLQRVWLGLAESRVQQLIQALPAPTPPAAPPERRPSWMWTARPASSGSCRRKSSRSVSEDTANLGTQALNAIQDGDSRLEDVRPLTYVHLRAGI